MSTAKGDPCTRAGAERIVAELQRQHPGKLFETYLAVPVRGEDGRTHGGRGAVYGSSRDCQRGGEADSMTLAADVARMLARHEVLERMHLSEAESAETLRIVAASYLALAERILRHIAAWQTEHLVLIADSWEAIASPQPDAAPMLATLVEAGA